MRSMSQMRENRNRIKEHWESMSKIEKFDTVAWIVLLTVAGIATLALILNGAQIMSGSTTPENYLSEIQLNGAWMVLLAGIFWCMFIMISNTSELGSLRKKVRMLEDELHGMDKEAEKES